MRPNWTGGPRPVQNLDRWYTDQASGDSPPRPGIDSLIFKPMKPTMIILLTVIAVAVIGGGAYLVGRSSANKNTTTTVTNTPSTTTNTATTIANTNLTANTNTTLSLTPDQATYAAYFSGAVLGKMPANQDFNPSLFTQTTTYTQADKFCTSLDFKQNIALGQLSTATYNSGTKQFVRPKATFQHTITTGNSIGCEDLALNTGSYEYQIYINDILAVIMPFNVQ